MVSPPILIRQLDEPDAGEALTLQRAAFVAEGRLYANLDIPPLTETAAELAAAINNSLTLGAFLSGRLVGSLRLSIDTGADPTIGWIGRVVTAPDQEGRGIASRLLREIELIAPAEVCQLTLSAGALSHRNIALYERHGYSIVGTHIDSAGTDMVRMTKPRRPVLLLISGSLRNRSTNRAVLHTFATFFTDPAQVAVLHGPSPAELPHYSPDVTELPESVARLRSAIGAARGLVFSTPEYAGTLPGAFKNLLDWTVGGTELAGKHVGWINTSPAPTAAAGAHAALRTVVGFVGGSIVDDLCVALPLGHPDVGTDLLVAHPHVHAVLHLLSQRWADLLAVPPG